MSSQEALSSSSSSSSADQTQNQLLPPPPPPKIESELKLTTSTLSSFITPFVHPQGMEVKKDHNKNSNRYQMEENDEDVVVGVRKQGSDQNKEKGNYAIICNFDFVFHYH